MKFISNTYNLVSLVSSSTMADANSSMNWIQTVLRRSADVTRLSHTGDCRSVCVYVCVCVIQIV